MSVTNVYHKSREHSITLNFSETENNLSWAFVAENDGVIFDLEFVNVASCLIEGNVIVLPISVSAGQSYSISIIKTTAGEPSSVVLKTRRAVNKSTILTVPDFGANDGRWLYALSSDGVVFKLDTELLVKSNYISNGAFTTNPIISQITLPSMANFLYTKIITLSTGDMGVFGSVLGNGDLWGSIIKSNDEVVGFDDVINGITNLAASSFGTGTALQSIRYDYVNNMIAYSSQASSPFLVQLNGPYPNRVTYKGGFGGAKSYFSPIQEGFAGVTIYKHLENRHIGFLYENNFVNQCGHLRNVGLFFKKQNNSHRWLAVYDINGSYLGFVQSSEGTSSNSNLGHSVCENTYHVITYPNENHYCVHDLTPSAWSAKNFSLNNPADAASGYVSFCSSEKTNYHFAIGGGDRKRLHLFDTSDYKNVEPNFGYLDLPNSIEDVQTNQFL